MEEKEDVSGFELLIYPLWFTVLGIWFCVSGCGLRVQGPQDFGFRVPECTFLAEKEKDLLGFGVRVYGLWFLVWGFECMISGFQLRGSGIGIGTPGAGGGRFGFRVSSFGFMSDMFYMAFGGGVWAPGGVRPFHVKSTCTT